MAGHWGLSNIITTESPIRTAARQPVAGIAEASLRALAKLQQVLPPRLGRHVSTLTAATVSSPAGAGVAG